jgi:hypothetical protein
MSTDRLHPVSEYANIVFSLSRFARSFFAISYRIALSGPFPRPSCCCCSLPSFRHNTHTHTKMPAPMPFHAIKQKLFFFFFFFCFWFCSSTHLIAPSNTCLSPCCVNALHSRYLYAPSSLARFCASLKLIGCCRRSASERIALASFRRSTLVPTSINGTPCTQHIFTNTIPQ